MYVFIPRFHILQVIQRRARILEKYNLPDLNALSTGLIGNANNQPRHKQLERGCLCLVVVHEHLFIGKGTQSIVIMYTINFRHCHYQYLHSTLAPGGNPSLMVGSRTLQTSVW